MTVENLLYQSSEVTSNLALKSLILYLLYKEFHDFTNTEFGTLINGTYADQIKFCLDVSISMGQCK